MIIYLLRHQVRNDDAGFYSPLTQEGKYFANKKTKHQLNNLGITQIYCSPFLRTLQTIEPYINQNNPSHSIPKCVNIEYALYEIVSKMIFTRSNYLYFPENSWNTRFKLNKNYESYLPPRVLKYGECIYDIKKRVNRFMRQLINKYKNTDEVILLVTHMQIIHSIIEYMQLPTAQYKIDMGDIIRIL